MRFNHAWTIEPITLTACDLAFLEIRDAIGAGSLRFLEDQTKATQRPDGTWDVTYAFEFDPSAQLRLEPPHGHDRR